MDHMAEWVRFADAKATILTAGFGVVLTVLLSNAQVVVTAIEDGCPDAYVVGSLVGAVLVTAGYTLLWLTRAISPRASASYAGLNRFAWSTLGGATANDLIKHADESNIRVDAWRQVVDLSDIARVKFFACKRATQGFATFVLLGVACIAAATGMAG